MDTYQRDELHNTKVIIYIYIYLNINHDHVAEIFLSHLKQCIIPSYEYNCNSINELFYPSITEMKFLQTITCNSIVNGGIITFSFHIENID